MKKWEYEFIKFTKSGGLPGASNSPEEFPKKLNTLGQQGWRVINIHIDRYELTAILEREIPETKSPSLADQLRNQGSRLVAIKGNDPH